MKKILLLMIGVLLVYLSACTQTTTMTTETTTMTDTEPTTSEEGSDFVNIDPFELTIYDPFEDDRISTPEKSDFFATVSIEDKASYDTLSDGDLWPMAWSDDDYLYTANGDGLGFDLSGPWADIAVGRISGHPDSYNFRGERIYPETSVGQIWGHPNVYNRKPTGMVSVDGVLYLAVQDLNKSDGPGIFNDAPRATILRSDDKGKSWHWDPSQPMFSDYVFTTIMFLDYGKDSSDNTFDDYVYAYALDYNWRDSFSNTVTDPQNLYLARMPKTGIQDVSTWEFYTGDLAGNATWSEPGDIDAKQPVLTDERRVYADRIEGRSQSMSVLSQGSIVYNKAIDRYIYSSWTEYTFEFYEAPTPWGPWRDFYSKDFGPYPWKNNVYGGYATVIPSKLISDDGLTMWVNANTFVGGVVKYNLSMRRLFVTLAEESVANNEKIHDNLADPTIGSNPTGIARATDLGLEDKLNDGRKNVWDTSYNDRLKSYDYWGITWDHTYTMNELVYTVGKIEDDGGWFENMKIQVRRDHEWIDVENLRMSNNYAFDETVESFMEVTFRFDEIEGDGVRVIGVPGGTGQYTSAAEIEVFYRDPDTE